MKRFLLCCVWVAVVIAGLLLTEVGISLARMLFKVPLFPLTDWLAGFVLCALLVVWFLIGVILLPLGRKILLWLRK